MRSQLVQKRRIYAWMQDGVQPHLLPKCGTTLVYRLEVRWSSDKFEVMIDQEWPPSPDLNPLDLWFWRWEKSIIYHHKKPETWNSYRMLTRSMMMCATKIHEMILPYMFSTLFKVYLLWLIVMEIIYRIYCLNEKTEFT